MNKTVTWIVVVIIILGGWYALSRGTSAPARVVPVAQTASSTASAARPQAGALLSIASSTALGSYLVGANGMTLYTFKKDAANVSNCSGTCATIWPPYFMSTTSPQPVSQDVTGKVGALTRAGGAMQVTYNGQPLYFFKSDFKPGDTNGQGVKGVWFVAKP